MTDMMNFQSLPKAAEEEEFAPTIRPVVRQVPQKAPIGRVVQVGGGSGRVELEVARLAEVARDPDPSVALSGQVGGNIKLEAGDRWLLANVRSLQLHEGEGGLVVAEIDFLGEGEEQEQTGRSDQLPPRRHRAIRRRVRASSRSPPTT